MLKITLRLPRNQKDFIHYTGDADKYLNLPIIIDGKPVGSITKILEDTDEYTEVEGILYQAGIDFIKNEDVYNPSDVTILKIPDEGNPNWNKIDPLVRLKFEGENND